MNGYNLSINASEQFIPLDAPRPVTVRSDRGLEERRLIGHVEMYGGLEYLQLWTCLALYVGSALLLWTAFPPLWDVDLNEWLSEERQADSEGYNTLLFRAVILVCGNSAFSLLALLYVLAVKFSLRRIGLVMVIIYAVQWLGCSSMGEIQEGPGAAVGFMRAYPMYTLMAWVVPIVLMVVAERTLRSILEMTVPIYEDVETGKLSVGTRDMRAV